MEGIRGQGEVRKRSNVSYLGDWQQRAVGAPERPQSPGRDPSIGLGLGQLSGPPFLGIEGVLASCLKPRSNPFRNPSLRSLETFHPLQLEAIFSSLPSSRM